MVELLQLHNIHFINFPQDIDILVKRSDSNLRNLIRTLCPCKPVECTGKAPDGYKLDLVLGRQDQ